MLTLALTEYEAGLCPGCGHPKHRVWNDEDGHVTADQDGYLERKTMTCDGCATQHAKRQYAPEPGQKDYVVWVPRGD